MRATSKRVVKWLVLLQAVILMLSLLATGVLGAASTPQKTYKVAFITTTLAHSVPAAWHQGILREVKDKPYIKYEVADGQWRADVQVAKMEDYINRKFDAIILQAQDAAALSASVKEAEDAGIFVVCLNLDVVQQHAGLVTMVTSEGGRIAAREMAKVSIPAPIGAAGTGENGSCEWVMELYSTDKITPVKTGAIAG